MSGYSLSSNRTIPATGIATHDASMRGERLRRRYVVVEPGSRVSLMAASAATA